ncbi:glycosyltransferase family 29 protein [Methylobrevis albus]|uniref:Glycosyltransferase family 29 protein n=1 Tax=Methylobrevis albus TaxID=2793297 RepID=A0A931I1P1_9HYPH|nr:glycosyltransferase family 29 protein [Methylobrevis albus]MBH0237648.1 glycosyltransferase family 29 protein [Methylobrevis albus]
MEFFAGKSVAIVGNAESLLTGNHGAEIEAHDLVLRMNRGVPTKPESQGSRTDVLVFAQFHTVAKFVNAFQARHLIWMSWFDQEGVDEGPALPEGIVFYDARRRSALMGRLKARPSVGAMVIDLVASSGVKTATVFGFDFKRTNTYYRQKVHIGPHDYDSEEQFCLETVEQNGWSIVRDY